MTNQLSVVHYLYATNRHQSVMEGKQVDITLLSRQAGLKCPVFLTRGLYDKFIVNPPHPSSSTEITRLKDIVAILIAAIRCRPKGKTKLLLSVFFCPRSGSPTTMDMVAIIGPLELDDDSPAITILLPEEDVQD